MLAHQNINWLAPKTDRLAHFLQEKTPDFIIITEHGLPQENLENTCLEGYSFVGGFSRKRHIKGGVAGYAKKELEKNITLKCTSANESELVCEMALFEIKLKKHRIQVLGVYRPPSAKLEDAINLMAEQLDRALQSNKQTVLLGDINVDNLLESNDNTRLEEFLNSYNLVRLTLPPTRITNESATSIDWICSNIDPNLIETSVILSGLSDHSAQIATLDIIKPTPDQLKERKRIFNNRTMDLFKDKLKTQNWHHVQSAEEVNEAYNNFHNILQLTLNETCPIRTIKRKQHKIKCYWDKECTKLKSAYITALETEQRTGIPEDKATTAARKAEYDLRLKSLRREHVTAYINRAENKSKALWQVINREKQRKLIKDIPPQLRINGETITSPQEIANCFNTFFATVADRTLQSNHSNLNPTLYALDITNHTFQFQLATEEEVASAISSLKPKTSSGIDDISAKLLKHCKEELTGPLADIINKSLTQGSFPSYLKMAKVYPLFKKGSPNEPGSYRPISLIPTFSKIIEKIVLKRLLSYLEQHSLLTRHQHGFIKGRSTTTALIELTEHIINQLEDGLIATTLFLDFSKAFDCLNHDQLLKKLRTIGIRGKEAEWFRSYLKDRTQLVEISHTEDSTIQKAYSETMNIHRGVPQGSVLGPVLFILLTNDLPAELQDSCNTVMYADDTALTLSNKSIQALDRTTQTNLNKTKQYCTNNDLVLNENKTVQMTFSTKNIITDLIAPGLEKQNETKYLGITIDSKLTWKPHLDKLCKKLSSGTYVIRRMKQGCGLDAAKVAYFALFESHLRYGIETWGGTTITNLERVLKQQKRAIRCLAGIRQQESCRGSFKTLQILTVVSLYIRQVILHAVTTQQTRHREIHQHNTRHATDFTLPVHHLTLFARKPSYKGAALFNHLPEHLKNETNQRFKNQLTKWLLERPFYSEQEFLNT